MIEIYRPDPSHRPRETASRCDPAVEDRREPGWDRRPLRGHDRDAAEARDPIPCTRAAADHWLR